MTGVKPDHLGLKTGQHRQAWNDYTDMLHKDRQITAHQYETWTNPIVAKRDR